MRKRVVAIVPARSGSKGIRDKNILKLGNRTLLELAIVVGIDCKIIDDVYISTDSRLYQEIGLKAGAKSIGLRRKDLSGDNIRTVDVVIDLIERIEVNYEYVVLLQPTSPVRNPFDIEKMLSQLINSSADGIVSVTKLEEPHPYKLKKINENGFLEPFIKGKSSEVPRQQLPTIYKLSGSIYIIKTETLIRDRTFMPENTIPYISGESINIDDQLDYEYLKLYAGINKIYGCNET